MCCNTISILCPLWSKFWVNSFYECNRIKSLLQFLLNYTLSLCYGLNCVPPNFMLKPPPLMGWYLEIEPGRDEARREGGTLMMA